MALSMRFEVICQLLIRKGDIEVCNTGEEPVVVSLEAIIGIDEAEGKPRLLLREGASVELRCRLSEKQRNWLSERLVKPSVSK